MATTDKQHNWVKKHFKNPPFCYICCKLVWDIGKIGYYCTTCHRASHIDCNESFHYIPQFCSSVKHDWSKDFFDNSPTCSGCNNIIFSADKISGFSCTKCSIKSHKSCRNLTSKCESSKSLFSIVKSSFDGSSSSSGAASSNNSNTNSANTSYTNLLDSALNTPLGASGSVRALSVSCTIQPTSMIGNRGSTNLSVNTPNGKNGTFCNNNFSLSSSVNLASNNNSSSSLSNGSGSSAGGSGSNNNSFNLNLNGLNNNSGTSISASLSASGIIGGSSPSSSSSPNTSSTNLLSPLSPKSSTLWTTPSIPNSADSSSLRPSSLAKSHDPNSLASPNASYSNLLAHHHHHIRTSLTYHSLAMDNFSEFETIVFNPTNASFNQKLIFVEKIKSFFIGLSSKMDPSYDLSMPYRPHSSDDLYRLVNRFKSISHIFHYEMMVYSRFRTQSQIDQYKLTMELFLQLYYHAAWEEESEFILRLALDFYNHLCTHRADLENALIGMTPSKEIQRRIKKFFYINPDVDKNAKGYQKFKGSWDLRISRQSLIDNIAVWGTSVDDKDAILKTVKEFGSHLGKERLAPYDLVVIKVPKNWSSLYSSTVDTNSPHQHPGTPNSISFSASFLNGVGYYQNTIDPNHHEFDEGTFLFARYFGEADPMGLNCFVCIHPDERTKIRIPHSRIVSLPMIDVSIPVMTGTDRSKLERLITNPFDAFSTEVQTAVKDTTRQFLVKQGFNVDILPNYGSFFGGDKPVSLDELNQLKTKISSLTGNEELFASVDQMSIQFTRFFSQYLKKVYMYESKGDFQNYYYRVNDSGQQTPEFTEHLVNEYNHIYNNQYNQNMSIQTSPSLTSVGASISSSVDQHQVEIISEEEYVNATGFAQVKPFTFIKKQYTKFKPFMPTLKTLINDLESGKTYCLKARDTLQSLNEEINLAIEKVTVDYNAILVGTKKQELIKWWLQLISSTVDTYLCSKGFYQGVVPTNYIDEPPSSISKVKENLRIVNLVLRPSTQTEYDDRLKNLMAPLKKKIYHQIDEFLCLAESLLNDVLIKCKHLFDDKIMQLDKRENLNLHAILEVLKKLPAGHQDKPMEVGSLIKDILYIREMKNMEEKYYSNEILSASHPLAAGEKQTLSDIVPITGLIFSRLLRIKHELRTVIEVFGQKTSVRSPFPNVGHHGVIIGKKIDNDNANGSNNSLSTFN